MCVCCQRLHVLLLMRLCQGLARAPTWWVMGEVCARCGHQVRVTWRLDDARVGAGGLPPLSP